MDLTSQDVPYTTVLSVGLGKCATYHLIQPAFDGKHAGASGAQMQTVGTDLLTQVVFPHSWLYGAFI